VQLPRYLHNYLDLLIAQHRKYNVSTEFLIDDSPACMLGYLPLDSSFVCILVPRRRTKPIVPSGPVALRMITANKTQFSF
jgi:hypothetical protein